MSRGRASINQTFFAGELITVPALMRACAFTGIHDRDVIVFKNVRFHPSTRVQQNGVFKKLYSGERFWQQACSVTFLLDTCRRQAKLYMDGKKSFFKQNLRVDGNKASLLFFNPHPHPHTHSRLIKKKKTCMPPYILQSLKLPWNNHVKFK